MSRVIAPLASRGSIFELEGRGQEIPDTIQGPK